MIYFLQDLLTYRIKVGYTGKDEMKERLAAHKSSIAGVVYVLATRDGDKAIETALHRQFACYHVEGENKECFMPGPELINYIAGCRAVELAHKAASQIVGKLVAESFPESKAEQYEREELERQRKAWSLWADAEAAYNCKFTIEADGKSYFTLKIPYTVPYYLRKEIKEYECEIIEFIRQNLHECP